MSGPSCFVYNQVSMIQFNQITTRGGDSGETSLADGSRYPKNDLRIEVLGEVDELHSCLGLLKASLITISERDEIDWIERCLLRLGAMVAVPPSHPSYAKLTLVSEEDIHRLESWQRDMMDEVELPPHFVTYGSSESGARADLARAVCRRSERRLVALIRKRGMRELSDAQRFLNRLSDYLFVRARYLDASEGAGD